MSWDELLAADVDKSDVDAYVRLVGALRGVQDAMASMSLNRAAMDDLAADLRSWRARLEPFGTDDANQLHGRLAELPARGNAMVPPIEITRLGSDRLEAVVRFGRWFMGGGMAAHGGAVSLLFDEILGSVASLGAAGITRTACLTVNYRALTPIDVDLTVVGWIERQEGRKRFARVELRQGETVCAEGEGLFLVLRPEQGMGRSADEPDRARLDPATG